MIIGIAARRKNIDNVYNVALAERYLRGNYTYLLLLPKQDNAPLFALCDGFIIPGGYDIDPSYYNEKNLASNNIDCYNDELDFQIIAYAISNDKPLLGICRGLQAINVYLGGSLSQNVDNHDACRHYIYQKSNNNIELPARFLVSSYHHQALKEVANDLEVIYESSDGIAELVICNKHRIIATQYHPEIDNDENSLRIWQKFADFFKS